VEFITLDAQDYETALKEARTEYGPSVRVHTRNDYQIRKGMKKQRRCTITFYLVKERSLDEETLQDHLDSSQETGKSETKERNERIEPGDSPNLIDFPIESREHQQQLLKELLEENDFAEGYIQEAIPILCADRQFETLEELEMGLLEYIIEGVTINHGQYTKPKQFFVLLGPTGVGKTTTLVKMALFYQKSLYEKEKQKVALLSLDSYRTGATNQIELFSKDFGLDLFHAHSEEELSELLPTLEGYSLVLVDTMGKSANQGELSLHLKSLLRVLPQEKCSCALALSASHKNRDLERFVKLFSTYPLESMVVTKLDETEDIGNVLSVSKSNDLPLLFFTNGQKVPENLLKATNEAILSYLRGFALDLQALSQNQNTSNHTQ
jgi:flagellar biosynthesis protein FlhF